MKRLFLFLCIIFAINTFALTYNVKVPIGTHCCYIIGDWDDWTTFTEMIKVDETHYTIEIENTSESNCYKYCCGPSWTYVEKGASGEELIDRKYTPNDNVATWNLIYDPENPIENPTGDVTIYLEKETAYSTNYLYAWGGANNGSWPGTIMNETEIVNGIEFYKHTFKGATELINIIFNNGYLQTKDILGINKTTYYRLNNNTAQNTDVTILDINSSNNILWNVYYRNNEWKNVYAYVWDGANDKQYLGSWPGTKMNKNDEGLWELSFSTEELKIPMIIFNDYSGNQTEDLSLKNNSIYNYNGLEGDPNVKEEITWTFYYNDDNWGNVNAYVWDSGANFKEFLGKWPGSAMTKNNNNVWEISFTTSSTIDVPMVIFNNYNGEQTINMSLINGGIYNFEGYTEENIGTNIIVSLEQIANRERFKNMFIELHSLNNNNQTYSYAITDQSTYTFRGLTRNSTWNVILRNERGDIFGKIENIKMGDKDIELIFDSLLTPQEINLTVKTPDGKDITDNVTITWNDSQKKFISQSISIKGMVAGHVVYYQIALPKELSFIYQAPQETEYTINENDDNNIVFQLDSIPRIQLTGKIKDATNNSNIIDASINISQTFNNKYVKTSNIKTDKNGCFSTSIAQTTTTITVLAPNYISQTFLCDTLSDELGNIDISAISLKPIYGATIALDYTYTSCATEEGKQSWFNDYNNIEYTLYNKTLQKEIKEYNVQYPHIVLLEHVDEGNIIQIKASSKNKLFMPIETEVAIENQTAKATLNITELGKIYASYTVTDNQSVVGILYCSNGKLLKTYNYINKGLTIGELVDSEYTLVTMGNSTLFKTIYDITQLAETGLEEGKDYLVNTIKVTSGKIDSIHNETIPSINESKLYYTGDKTSFITNKSNIIAGNYLTLTGYINFKPTYEKDVSELKLIVEIPESCSFVENSVMVGSSISSYTINNNSITIPLNSTNEKVKFCIIPTTNGDYSVGAFAQFNINENSVKQPIGLAQFSVEDITINVPTTVHTPSVSVNGLAQPSSKVQIYDNDVLIGETISLANGIWNITCNLHEAYNLSTHNIFAKMTTEQGLNLQSVTKSCVYDMNAVRVKKVIMYHWNPEMNKTYESVFDFITPSSKSNQWAIYYPNKEFTYTIDFTNNSPEVVSNVVLYVHTSNNEVIPLIPTYDENKDLWVANLNLGSRADGQYPVNCSVDFEYVSEKLIDITEYEDFIENIKLLTTDYENSIQLISEHFENNGTLDYKEFYELTELLGIPTQIIPNNPESVLPEEFDSWSEEEQETFISNELTRITNENDELIKSLSYLDTSFSYNKEFEVEIDGIFFICKSCKGITIEELLADNFKESTTTKGTKVYNKITETSVICVDLDNDLYIESNIPQTQARAIKLLANDSKTGWQIYSDCMGALNDVLNIINTKWTELQQLAQFPENKINEAIKEIEIRLTNVSNWKNNSKVSTTKKLKWAIEEDRLAHSLASLKLAKKICGPLVNKLLKAVPYAGYVAIIHDCFVDSKEILAIFNSIEDPCPDDAERAKACKQWCYNLWASVTTLATVDVVGSFSSDAAIVGGVLSSFATAGTSLTATAAGAVGKAVIAIGGIIANTAIDISMDNLRFETQTLDCHKDCGKPGMPPCPDPKPEKDDDDGGDHKPGNPNDQVQIDPSGYVYEGVPSNRLEGVTATVYYKEMAEDMYGEIHENIIKWDAAEYSQENPLITDKNGMYRWDVPQGLWQVKYEKEGYETTYSEWLPVPPPQLEVNIAMKQHTQPVVIAARAYEDGIEFEFDKFMMSKLLNNTNISVLQNNVKVDGNIILVNEEKPTADSGNNTFTSKVRFNTAEPFSEKTVTLMIQNKVKSYAGAYMRENYVKELDVEAEIREIKCDSLIVAICGEPSVISISVLPAVASAGKTLRIESASNMIATTDAQSYTIDKNGNVEFFLTGELPGVTSLTYSIDDSDIKSVSAVKVVTYDNVCDAPQASIASETEVDKGTNVYLSCTTEGSIIYYTLDGTCPCYQSESVMIYDGSPIIINENTTIKAQAVAPNMLTSEIVEFVYYVKDFNNVETFTINDGITTYPTIIKDILNIKSSNSRINKVLITDINGNTILSLNTAQYEISISVSSLPIGVYIVNVITDKNSYKQKVIKKL